MLVQLKADTNLHQLELNRWENERGINTQKTIYQLDQYINIINIRQYINRRSISVQF